MGPWAFSVPEILDAAAERSRLRGRYPPCPQKAGLRHTVWIAACLRSGPPSGQFQGTGRRVKKAFRIGHQSGRGSSQRRELGTGSLKYRRQSIR
jgi:hypothetical protein